MPLRSAASIASLWNARKLPKLQRPNVIFGFLQQQAHGGAQQLGQRLAKVGGQSRYQGW